MLDSSRHARDKGHYPYPSSEFTVSISLLVSGTILFDYTKPGIAEMEIASLFKTPFDTPGLEEVNATSSLSHDSVQ